MNTLASQLAAHIKSSANLRAFLRVIREGESSQDEGAYRWLFGSTRSKPKLFDSFADHPRVRTYEEYDGQFIKNGKIDFTTAAGAYQITQTTWGDCVNALALQDFGQASQDIAAVWLIRRGKALDDVLAGRVRQAIAKLGNEWASLPSSTYGQPTKTLEHALRVYREWGGTERPDNTAAPITTITIPKEKPMAPLIKVLAGSLLEIFTPLAKEKLTKEMGRHTDKPEIADKIATTLVETAKAATGLEDPIEAVSAVRKSPELVAHVERESLESLDGMLTLAERMSKIDEASVASARVFSTGEPLMVDSRWIKLRFIHILSLIFVAFAGWFVVQVWDTLTPELRGAVVTLMIIAGWNGVKDFWMGSSDGSQRKTAALMEERRPTKP